MALAQAALRRSGVLGSSASEVKHLFRERLPSPRLTSPRLNLLSQRLHDAARRFHITSLICSGLGRGSELRGLSTERKATKHYGSLTSLLRQMGESTLPAIATIDGHVTGAAVGIGAFASACVVTERARMSLPGPAFGFVPESFASYQLARLPKGMGAYLSLTGASLSAREMVTQHLGRTLRNLDEVCMEPRFEDEEEALFHKDAIAESFGKGSLGEIVTSLEAGKKGYGREGLEYHKKQLDREVMQTVRLDATAEEEAEAEEPDISESEARKYGNVGVWEHDDIESVPATTVEEYFA
ncbi:MAG: hypothetical protein SGPRY_006199 [Prymnesium sp.]